MKLTLKVGAAMAAALALSVSLAACGDSSSNGSAAAAQVAMAPEGRTMSPGAVTRSLQGRGFTPTNVRRRGGTYVVDARGSSGNDVRLVVDGRAGQIRGMDVLRWAPGQKRIARGSRGNRFVNDTYEFGVTLEDALLLSWILYGADEWNSDVAWIEYEEVTDWEWSEIYYEDTVEEVSYELWEEEYGAIELYEESFYEETYWEETFGDEELYYEDESAYAEELTEEYGEEYYAEYEESEQYWEEETSTEEAYAEEDYDDGGAIDQSQDDSGDYDDGGAIDQSQDDSGDYDDGGAVDQAEYDSGEYDDGGAAYDDGGDDGGDY